MNDRDIKDIKDINTVEQHPAYRLSDPAIAGLMQLLQLSIMTGTSIDDLLRHMEFTSSSDGLIMTAECIDRIERFSSELEQRLASFEKDQAMFQLHTGDGS